MYFKFISLYELGAHTSNAFWALAVRVHKVVTRKGMSWKRGQNIKILRGAYAGVHNNNVYATIDYFLIEGFEDEAGG